MSERRTGALPRVPSLLVLALVGAIALATAFAASPLLALRALKAAARFGDASALAELVNYDAVRGSLRPQLVDPVSYREAPPLDLWRHPFASLGQMWRNRQLIPVRGQADANAYLSPAALDQILAGRGDPRRAPAGAVAEGRGTRPPAKLLYADLHRVRFGVSAPGAPGRMTVLTLHRGKGLFAWTLIGIRLPDAAPVTAALR